jgi:soluble lytic murein transglycosylase-like protein
VTHTRTLSLFLIGLALAGAARAADATDAPMRTRGAEAHGVAWSTHWGGIPQASLLYVRELGYRQVLLALIAGHQAKALRALDAFEASTHGPLGYEEQLGLDLLRARLLEATGDRAGARAALEALIDEDALFVDEARMRLAALLDAAGQPSAALAHYLAVEPFAVDGARAAFEALKRLLPEDRGPRTQLRFDALRERVPRLARRLRGVPEAWWPTAAEPDPAAKLRERMKKLRRAARGERRTRSALKQWTQRHGASSGRYLLAEAVARCDDETPERSTARFEAAAAKARTLAFKRVLQEEWIRCALDFADPGGALARFDAYAQDHGAAAGYPDTARRVLRVLIRERLLARAARLVEALSLAHPDDSAVPRSWFDLGLIALQGGRHDDALRAFTLVRAHYGHRLTDGAVTWGEKTRYWEACAELEAGRGERALALFQALVDEHPSSIYRVFTDALLMDRLDAPLQPRPRPRAPGLLPEYLVLQDLGLNREAHRSLEHVLLQGAPIPESDQRWFLWLDTLVAGRHPETTLKRRRALITIAPERMPEAFWRRLYDLPFAREIEAAARPVGLPALLLAAIVNKESRFDETVRSYAGAVGLSQLMPSVARYVIDQHPLDIGKSRGAISRASNNLRIGAVYLQSLVKGFRSVPLAVLAYNVGPGRVSRYLAELVDVDRVDLFLERIPTQDGRDFALKVLTSYVTYARLQRGRPARIGLDILVRPKQIPIIRKPRLVSRGERAP